jgi:hypothetical protein
MLPKACVANQKQEPSQFKKPADEKGGRKNLRNISQ